ncbi:hypothetical protein FV222_02435 [Methylobacterium sp. WL103]|uniref:hypothetical protein n=1 Tax=Methylobacterium sp. WL103 TaxID=2603891 RepID=UPI0011CA7A92|nr:hypothetical protein [Methylobacterium sp. WL103]TXN07378.1 hypothetical protein FV222_02435 [Methylobacterium sp. WL103]
MKLQLDQLSARCDAFAKVVEGAMDLALEYWLTGVPSDATPVDASSDAGRTRDAAIVKLEIRLRGAQAALQAGVERMVVDLPLSFRHPLRAEFQNVIDALTGDPFGDRSGHTESDKAMNAISSGTRLVRIVREGRDEVSKLPNMVRYMTGLSGSNAKLNKFIMILFMTAHNVMPFIIILILVLSPAYPALGDNHCENALNN